MCRIVQSIFCILLLSNLCLAQSNEALIPKDFKAGPVPKTKEIVNLNLEVLQKNIYFHPNNSLEFVLPLNDKEFKFIAIPNDVFINDEQQVDKIYTYDLKTVESSSIYGALTASSDGLYFTIYNLGKTVSIYPLADSDSFVIEYGIQPEDKLMSKLCDLDVDALEFVRQNEGTVNQRFTIGIGSKRYTYDVALVCTGEYYTSNGNNDNTVRTSMINTLNSISAIFKNELSITLQTRSNLIKMYNNPSTDPFSPGSSRVQQARDAIAANFSSNSYNLGHVFHHHEDGDGWESGGIAQLNSVCNNSGSSPAKGGGWSGSFNNVGNGWINLSAHEFAHQFGANHTFNGTGGSCTDNITFQSAVEIGSGTTIMAYNGICGSGQNIPASGESDNYFHIWSLNEIYNFVYNGSGGSCGTNAVSPNLLPEVTANPCGADYKIPKNTPFYLNADGTFPDNDNHTFCWEQIDAVGAPNISKQGKIGTAAANDNTVPLFRSYPPVQESYRYFPNLAILASGQMDPFDVLPNVARTLNFNVTVRDNNSGGGAVASDDIKMTVVNSGPLTVTRPNGGESFTAGNTELIQWNTNGSNDLCSNVRLKLSFDGGKTFSYVLAENVDYGAGSYNAELPSAIPSSTDVRLMVECMDYDCFSFFNLSKNSFKINSDCKAALTTINPDDPKSYLAGDSRLNLNLKNNLGKKVLNFTGSLRNSDESGSLIFLNGTPATCLPGGNSVNFQSRFFTVDILGSYTFRLEGPFGLLLNLYEQDFTGTNCTNFITSTATRPSGSGAITLGSTLTATLQPGRHYYFVVSSFADGTPVLPANYKITPTNGPPSASLFDGIKLGDNYSFTYVAVERSTGVVRYINEDSDFIGISDGEFCISGVVYNKNTDPESWLGQALNQLIQNGVCMQLSTNCKPLDVLPSCKISEIQPGSQTSCDEATNTYTQKLIVTYDMPPNSSLLVINGQEFEITESPQICTLIDLEADGQPVNISAFFSELPSCKYEESSAFTSPENCCPIDLDLGPDLTLCQGGGAILDAGNQGVFFVWTKDGVEVKQGTENKLEVSTSGYYEVVVTSSQGCTKRDGINVEFEPGPQINYIDEISFCSGNTYILEPMISGAESYKWYKNGTLITTATEQHLQITEGGTYKVVATSANNCGSEWEVLAREITATVNDFGENQQRCDGEIVILDAGSTDQQYVWYFNGNVIPGANESTYEVTQSGTYKVEGGIFGSCTATSEVRIDFFESPSVDNLPELIDFCQGDPTEIGTTASGYSVLQWYFEGNPISNSNVLSINANNSGVYTLQATNPAGCSTETSTQVEIHSLPVINLGPDELVACIGSEVLLDAGRDGVDYSWSKDGVLLSESDHLLNVTNSGLYIVSVVNAFNCEATDNVNVSFIEGPEVTLTQDATICEGTDFEIEVTVMDPNPTIKWLNSAGNVIQDGGEILVVNEADTYSVLVIAGNPSCEITREVTINVDPRPALNLGNNRTLCEGDVPPILNGGEDNVTYRWYLNDTFIGDSQNVTADESGTYRVFVENEFGCTREEEVTINYVASPTLSNIDEAYNRCDNEDIIISALSNAADYTWTLNGNTIDGQNSNEMTITESGEYHVVVKNETGCETSFDFTVFDRPSPSVDLGADFDLCPGESKIINAGDQFEYLWSNGSSEASYEVIAGQPDRQLIETYSVTVTNEFGCSVSDELMVTLHPVVKAVITSDSKGVCNGQPVTLTASGGVFYEWTDETGTLSVLNGSVTVAQPKENTIYTVTVIDDICDDNTDTASIEVEIFEPVNVSAGLDTCVVIGRSIRLNASGGVAYQWNHQELIDGRSDIANPEVRPTIETTFTVMITDKNGCIYEDQVTVCVKEDVFKLISIITPNGDGKNDFLFFPGIDDDPNNSLKIYNRWGTLIFEQDGYQIQGRKFDGIRNGERLPADTYYYILTYQGETYKSSLTILWD